MNNRADTPPVGWTMREYRVSQARRALTAWEQCGGTLTIERAEGMAEAMRKLLQDLHLTGDDR